MDIVVDVERTFFGVVKAKVLFAERIVLIKEDFGLWLLLQVKSSYFGFLCQIFLNSSGPQLGLVYTQSAFLENQELQIISSLRF